MEFSPVEQRPLRTVAGKVTTGGLDHDEMKCGHLEPTLGVCQVHEG